MITAKSAGWGEKELVLARATFCAIRFTLRFLMLTFYTIAAIGMIAGDWCERCEQRF